MAKKSIQYCCVNCGHQSPKWIGKCPGCGEWNSFEEESVELKKQSRASKIKSVVHSLSEIDQSKIDRIDTGYSELNRVLGGGMVQGSITLFGGEPGIGKSTLLLKICDLISNDKSIKKVIYFSGEESLSQIASRANRLSVESKKILLAQETSWEKIKSTLEEEKPDLFIVDSIQTTLSDDIPSAPGSVSQIREVTFELMNYCKAKNVSSFIVGHITKDGNIAGPKILEHMVDVVIYFEGDRQGHYRLLRSIKNRFGNTNEVGIFEMNESGLEEVLNPSQFFLEDSLQNSYGSSLTCIAEGSRPLMLEIQALVVENKFGNGRRSAQGIDNNRLPMLLAVIEKYFGILMSSHDVYVNVLGGIKSKTRDTDLCVLTSVVSSIFKVVIPKNMIFVGEVGLTGEVRSIPFMEMRIKELIQLGYKDVVISNSAVKKLQKKYDINLIGIREVIELKKILGL